MQGGLHLAAESGMRTEQFRGSASWEGPAHSSCSLPFNRQAAPLAAPPPQLADQLLASVGVAHANGWMNAPPRVMGHPPGHASPRVAGLPSPRVAGYSPGWERADHQMKCASCQQLKAARSSFSTNQIKRGSGKGRCIACIQASKERPVEPPLPLLHPPETSLAPPTRLTSGQHALAVALAGGAAMQAPAMHAPAMQAPAMQAPAMQAPAMQALPLHPVLDSKTAPGLDSDLARACAAVCARGDGGSNRRPGIHAPPLLPEEAPGLDNDLAKACARVCARADGGSKDQVSKDQVSVSLANPRHQVADGRRQAAGGRLQTTGGRQQEMISADEMSHDPWAPSQLLREDEPTPVGFIAAESKGIAGSIGEGGGNLGGVQHEGLHEGGGGGSGWRVPAEWPPDEALSYASLLHGSPANCSPNAHSPDGYSFSPPHPHSPNLHSPNLHSPNHLTEMRQDPHDQLPRSIARSRSPSPPDHNPVQVAAAHSWKILF